LGMGCRATDRCLWNSGGRVNDLDRNTHRDDRPWVTLLSWVDAWLAHPTMLRRAATTLLDAQQLREGTTDHPADWSALRVAITTDGLSCRVLDRDRENSSESLLADRVENLFLRTSLEALAWEPFLAERYPLGARLLFPSGSRTNLTNAPIFDGLETLAIQKPIPILRERLAYLRDGIAGNHRTIPDLVSANSADADLPLREHPPTALSDAFDDKSISETVGPDRRGGEGAIGDEPHRSDSEPGSPSMPGTHRSAPVVPIDHLLMVRTLPPVAVALLRDSYGIETADQLRDRFPDNLPTDWQRDMERWLLRSGAPLPKDRFPDTKPANSASTQPVSAPVAVGEDHP